MRSMLSRIRVGPRAANPLCRQVCSVNCAYHWRKAPKTCHLERLCTAAAGAAAADYVAAHRRLRQPVDDVPRPSPDLVIISCRGTCHAQYTARPDNLS